MPMKPLAAAMGSLLTLYAGAASADERSTFRAALGTRAPADIGVEGSVELPGRLRIATSVGMMPGFYLDLINGLAEDFGWYSAQESALIRAALQQSFVWRTQLGWRPFAKVGWYFSGGYALAALGGSTSAEELVVAAGVDPPIDHVPERQYDLGAIDHFLTFETGYEWFFTRDLYLQGSIGVMATVAASASMDPKFQPVAARVNEQFRARVQSYLEDLLTSYVHTPTIGLWLGYRFH